MPRKQISMYEGCSESHAPHLFSPKLFTQNVWNLHKVLAHASFLHVFPRCNLRLTLRLYTSTKQGRACLPCTSSFPVHVSSSSLHESRSHHFQIVFPRSAPFSGPKGMEIGRRQIRTTGRTGEYSQPNTAIASWVLRPVWGWALSCSIKVSTGF